MTPQEALAAALVAVSEPDWLGRIRVGIPGDSREAAAAILRALQGADHD